LGRDRLARSRAARVGLKNLSTTKRAGTILSRYPVHHVSAETSIGGTMKIVFNILGVLMVLMGAIWFLQGINILPGSFMTGQMKWAVYGACMVVAGLLVLTRANRRVAS
jgi:uncharacterized membrane protein